MNEFQPHKNHALRGTLIGDLRAWSRSCFSYVLYKLGAEKPDGLFCRLFFFVDVHSVVFTYRKNIIFTTLVALHAVVYNEPIRTQSKIQCSRRQARENACIVSHTNWF